MEWRREEETEETGLEVEEDKKQCGFVYSGGGVRWPRSRKNC
jgi:hypothetical protein